jgi:DnaJ-class molecular chaperone
MAEDYYKTLGVGRDASAAEIQRAYRDLARKFHPDMNPDDPSATKKFQQIQAAFDVLNSPEKREMYDRYGSSFETMGAGAGPGGGSAAGFGGGPGEVHMEDIDFGELFGQRFGGGGPAGLGDIFSQFRRGGGRAATRRRGADVTAEVQVPFNTAINGGEVQLSLQRQAAPPETIVVRIPPGIDDGNKIRLRGQGEPAPRSGTAGDLLLTVHVAPHPSFSRRGNHLYLRVPITLGEAAAGATVDVPTPTGTVALHVPPATSSGTKLRIQGHGVPGKKGAAGDLFVEVLIVLPKKLEEADREALRQIDARHPLNPRQNLRW